MNGTIYITKSNKRVITIGTIMENNPVAKHMNTFNKAKVFVDRKKKLKTSKRKNKHKNKFYIE